MKGIVYFDGVCNLCSGFVQFLIKNDPDFYFKFASLQSEIGQKMAKKYQLKAIDFDTVVYQENDAIYTKSEAVFRIANHLNRWKWLLVFRFLPKKFLDFLYDQVAQNRYRFFGKKTSCWLPSPELAKRFF